MDYLLTMDSPVGPVTVASDGEAIIGLWLEGQKYFEATLETAEEWPDLPVLAETRAWLERYFAGDDPGALPPVSPRGTAFQQRVWAQLAEIPYGQLTTYGQIARRLEEQTGTRTSARAVGSAVGRNPISIILPCHRVVGSTGSLTGYAGGLQKKIALLGIEGVDVEALSVPKRGTAL